MSKKVLLSSGIGVIVTVFFLIAYVSFNALGITRTKLRRYEITLVSMSASKVYDGEVLAHNSWYIESGGLEDGDSLSVTMASQITNAGSIDNELGVTITDIEGYNVTENYKINYKLGKLTVLKKPLSIQTESAEKVYDGISLTNQTWQVTGGTLLETHSIQTLMASNIKYPGTVDNDIDIEIYNESEQLVTDNYDITYDLGTLTVYPRLITIQTHSDFKVYDGTPLMNDGWYIQSGSISAVHRIEAIMLSQITEPGEIENEIGITIYDEFDQIVTDRYEIQYEIGSLSVYARPITIQTESKDKVYDGTPLTSDQWVISSGSISEIHRIEAIMVSSITNPGSVNNDIGITIFDEQNQMVTHLYDISTNVGNLTVHPSILEIRTEDRSKVYDGLPLTSQGWTITNGSLSPNHRLEWMMTTSITNPGSVENDIGITIYDEFNQIVTDIYQIYYDLGDLTIEPKPISIRTGSAEKIYDGIPLTNTDWEIYGGELYPTHRIETQMTTSITNPGVINNELGFTIYDEFNQDVTAFYRINYQPGTLHVLKRTISIETASDFKTYDGMPLSNDQWTLIAGSLLEGHQLITSMPSSITNPGRVDNLISVTILDEFNENITNRYQLQQYLGDLYVYKRELDIRTETKSKAYDGTALTSQNWVVTSGTWLSGHQPVVTMTSSITNPGYIDNQANLIVYDAALNDVSNMYNINYDYGKLTIEKRALVISTGSDEKAYDGTPLTDQTYRILGGQLLSGHTLYEVMPASITTPGTIDNVMTPTILDENGMDITYRYNIQIDEGTLEVLPISVIIMSGSASKVYDGTPLTSSDWAKLSGTLLPNHQLFVETTGEITDVGTVKNSVFAYVLDNNSIDVSYYYDFTYHTGDLTILTSLYASDEIAKESFAPVDEPVFEVFSNTASVVYFKDKSWGNYNLSGWTTGIVHQANIDTNPLSFSAKALEEAGRTPYTLEMTYLREQVPYLLPYYSSDPLNGLSDVHIYGSVTEPVSHQVIRHSYASPNQITLQNSSLALQEQTYRDYVYDTYLTVPSSTKTSMLQIAEANNINALSPTLVEDVQNYIRQAAVYNLNFAKIPATVEDIAVYFLTVSKEGICQHFATAGTLMYRSLGIPARYATGYVYNVKANQVNTVTGLYAHAWVEVYIDGFGWVPVEVTGGGPGETLIDITVRPNTVKAVYEPGMVIQSNTVLFSGFSEYAALGYTYDVTFEGSLSEPGIAISRIKDITIYDENLQDVTYMFNIDRKEAILQLYEFEIDLVTYGGNKTYDGTPSSITDYRIDGALGSGHQISSVTFTGSQLYVGTSKNRAAITISDAYGNDVTHLYKINNLFGNLVVMPRAITITSADATKVFDGTPLVDHEYVITSGSLAETDSLFMTFSGVQTSVGSSINTIEDISILQDGKVVTNNYIIEIIEGELSVTPNYN